METTGKGDGESLLAWLQVTIPPWQEGENARKRPSALLLKYGSNFSPATRGTSVAALHLNHFPLVGRSHFSYGFVFTCHILIECQVRVWQPSLAPRMSH